MTAFARTSKVQASAWLVALAGFAAMYLPVYWWAAKSIWQTDEQAHGAIILLVVGWLFWEKKAAILSASSSAKSDISAGSAGWVAFALGVLVYLLGRVLGISILEIGSQVPVLLGSILILGGWSALKAGWFPLAYVLFMIPLPGSLVDALTGPLKQLISVTTEHTLYAAGYPIARNGVMLSIGQYQLLVADACSGLHSMFSLSALGLLYMYLSARASLSHNCIMLASILPIAVASNIVRVITLVMVTYHFGDEAGQGFLHGAAGILLLIVALVILFMLDIGLAKMIRPSSPAPRS